MIPMVRRSLRVLIPRGDDPPYAVDDNKVYVRDEAETGLAVRDEIVSLVLRSRVARSAPPTPKPEVEKLVVAEEAPQSSGYPGAGW